MKKLYNFSLLDLPQRICAKQIQSNLPIYLIPSSFGTWPPNDGQSTDRGVRRKKMCSLPWTSTKATFRVLPCHYFVNHPSHIVNPRNGRQIFLNSPLLVPRIQSHLQDAECLHRPKNQPGLTRILADVSRRETLDKIPYKELHVRIFQKGRRRRCRCRIWDMFYQHGFGLRLSFGRECRKAIDRCWAKFHDDDFTVAVVV